MPLYPGDIWYVIVGYLLYRRIQDILYPTTKKFPSQLFWKMHIFSAKKPQPQGLNPNQQVKIIVWYTKSYKPI